MNQKTTPDEPGLPPRRPFASFLGRGLWLGILIVLIITLLTWLIFEWMTSY